MIDNEMVPHTVIDGQRWDTIAEINYGNPGKTAPIIASNPTVPITGRLKGGIIIYVPVLNQDNSISLPSQSTPPWRK